MKRDNNNLMLAIAMSIFVIVGWNYFFGVPQMQKAKQQAAQPHGTSAPNVPGIPAQPGNAPAGGTASPTAEPEMLKPREEALQASPRVAIDTPRLRGSIALKGARIDDVILKNYRETTDPNSPNIVLFSPSGTAQAYYAEAGYTDAAAPSTLLPAQDSVWKADGTTLTPDKPLTLTFDTGAGLVFKRTISIDDQYMFTLRDSVANKSDKPVNLGSFALVSRHYRPTVSGYSIFHEGLIADVGDSHLQEMTYDGIEKEVGGEKAFTGAGGFIGITDKYWAAAVAPDQSVGFKGTFRAYATPTSKHYQTDVRTDPKAIAPGANLETTTHIFAGAKVSSVIDKYQADLGIKNFAYLIDWGTLWFITQPLFKLLDLIYKFVGNFGISILISTVLIKAALFPLANRGFQSMAKMKAVAPRLEEVKKRFPDDKQKQQQAIWEVYRAEKINPLAGCLPILIQAPIFFALYKVIFVTIEMRHAPFFGWIKDLSAPDPTNVFTLFGLLPFTPPSILHLGIWPLIMGCSMFVQMKMNPEPPDPVQKAMFAWMPVIFTFMLGSFPAGLVIYWTWNNILTATQQYFIMKKAGQKVELWSNLMNTFRRKKAASP